MTQAKWPVLRLQALCRFLDAMISGLVITIHWPRQTMVRANTFHASVAQTRRVVITIQRLFTMEVVTSSVVPRAVAPTSMHATTTPKRPRTTDHVNTAHAWVARIQMRRTTIQRPPWMTVHVISQDVFSQPLVTTMRVQRHPMEVANTLLVPVA